MRQPQEVKMSDNRDYAEEAAVTRDLENEAREEVRQERFILEATDAFIDTLVWSSYGPNGEALELSYTGFDFTDEATKTLNEEVTDFIQANWLIVRNYLPDEIGIDFALTRNEHGSGFWDGDYPEDDGEALTKAARAYGWIEAYVNDDGRLDIS